MMRIAIDWPPSTVHGWGVYALNLALALADDPEAELWFPDGGCVIDPLRYLVLTKPRLWKADDADVFLHALGNDVLPEPTTPRERTIGAIFFEEPLTLDAITRAKRYPLILTGSDWNTKLLRDAGANAMTVHQGVDRTLFHPAPKLLSGRFAVFSGGKAEWRKGQDLVLKAFKIFADTHDDAVLVTSWHSPFPMFAAKMGAPIRDGRIDVYDWASLHGIKREQIIDLGVVHNPMMPQIYREMACAIFPNRAEGGTNLVAMEAMACGVHTLLSKNTGHLDVKKVECDWLPQSSFDAIGRGETDPGEIDAALEWAYDIGGLEGALTGFHWSDTAGNIKQACKTLVKVDA